MGEKVVTVLVISTTLTVSVQMHAQQSYGGGVRPTSGGDVMNHEAVWSTFFRICAKPRKSGYSFPDD
jgi:hypothetical protein